MVAGIGLRCHKCESDFERDTLIEDEWCWMPHIQSLFFLRVLVVDVVAGVLLLTYSYRLFALLVFIFFVLCLKCSSCGCCARPTPSHTKIYCIFFLYRVIYLFSDIMCVAFEITPFSGDDIWKYVFPIFFFIKISGTGFFCFLRLCVNCSALLFSWQQRCVRTLLRWEIRLCASGGSWIVRFSIYIFFFFCSHSLTYMDDRFGRSQMRKICLLAERTNYRVHAYFFFVCSFGCGRYCCCCCYFFHTGASAVNECELFWSGSIEETVLFVAEVCMKCTRS